MCTESVPFVDDGCDTIEKVHGAVISTRLFGVLHAIVSIVALLVSSFVVTASPDTMGLFISSLIPAGSAACGVLATISFGASSGPVIADTSRATSYGSGFFMIIFAWLLDGTATILMFIAYVAMSQEVSIAGRRQGVGKWAAKNRKKVK